jgi:transcription elongation GreA/GreB family factor
MLPAMSRAFVRENDGAEVPGDRLERPVSAHPNFVTARGLQKIESRIRDLESERDAARLAEDDDAIARVERDLRYWQQRKSSAKLIEPDPSPAKVRFGVRVTVRYDGGDERSYTLVGEDEAEPAQGRISWLSPIAQALIGAAVGDEVRLQDRRAEIIRLQSGS